MTYEEALAYLGSLEALGIRPGLDRIQALLRRLGDPQACFDSVLIAGTNGKGSVAAFVASILRQAGHACGVYTSPHLVNFEERIVVGRQPITATQLAALTSDLRAVIDIGRLPPDERPTYFEATTALAFLHFSREKVPITVLEVGMGGRFDATNVVTPKASAITRIAMDHVQWLGGSLGEIAGQKAGILKRGVPTIVSRQDREALQVILDEAVRSSADVVLTSDSIVRPAGRSGRFPDPPVFSLTTPAGGRYPEIGLTLRGVHQVENAVTAVLLAEQLAAQGVSGIDPGAITTGLRQATWPGRLEFVNARPDLLLDGAHNPSGCAALAAYLREYQADRPKTLVFAAMKDKPAAEMLDILCPLVRRVVVTPLSVPRGETPENLHALAVARHADTARAGSVQEALRLAAAGLPPDGLVVVSGSLYLVGEVKRALG